MTAVKVTVRLDKRALDRELDSRQGTTGQVLSGFAGTVTRELKGAFTERAGGAWWPVSSSIRDKGSRGMNLVVNVKATRPHRIRARNAPVLYFYLRDGALFVGDSVSHPGSSAPVELVNIGIERAGRRLTFTGAAPRFTNV